MTQMPDIYNWGPDIMAGIALGEKIRRGRESSQRADRGLGLESDRYDLALRQQDFREQQAQQQEIEDQQAREEYDSARGFFASQYENLAPMQSTFEQPSVPGGIGPPSAPGQYVPNPGESDRMSGFGDLPLNMQSQMVDRLQRGQDEREIEESKRQERFNRRRKNESWLEGEVASGRVSRESPYYQQIVAQLQLRSGDVTASSISGLYGGGGQDQQQIDPNEVYQQLIGSGVPEAEARRAAAQVEATGKVSSTFFTGSQKDPRLDQLDDQMFVNAQEIAVVGAQLKQLQFQTQQQGGFATKEIVDQTQRLQQAEQALQQHRLELVRARVAMKAQSRQAQQQPRIQLEHPDPGAQVDGPPQTNVPAAVPDGQENPFQEPPLPKSPEAQELSQIQDSSQRLQRSAKMAMSRLGMTSAPARGTPERQQLYAEMKRLLEEAK